MHHAITLVFTNIKVMFIFVKQIINDLEKQNRTILRKTRENQEWHKLKKKSKCSLVELHSPSRWLTWRCWTAGRWPRSRVAQGSLYSKGWPGPETWPRRWSWAASRTMVWARWRSRSCRGWWTPHDSPIPAPYCCSASYTETESREREKEGKTGKLVGRREEEEPQVNSRGRDGRREVKQHR